MTRDFNVAIVTRADGPRSSLPDFVHEIPLNRLCTATSIVALRYPLAPSAGRVVGAAALDLVGPATVVVGANQKPLIGRRRITCTLRRGELRTCYTSIVIRRPPRTSGPLFDYDGTCLAPRLT